MIDSPLSIVIVVILIVGLPAWLLLGLIIYCVIRGLIGEIMATITKDRTKWKHWSL